METNNGFSEETLIQIKGLLTEVLAEHRAKLLRGMAAILGGKTGKKTDDEELPVQETTADGDLFRQPTPPADAPDNQCGGAKPKEKKWNEKPAVERYAKAFINGEVLYLDGRRRITDMSDDEVRRLYAEHKRSCDAAMKIVATKCLKGLNAIAARDDNFPIKAGSLRAICMAMIESGCDIPTLKAFFNDFAKADNKYNPAEILRDAILRGEIDYGNMLAEFIEAFEKYKSNL